MKLTKLALAAVVAATMCSATASAQLFDRAPRLWQPDLFRLSVFGRQDAPTPAPEMVQEQIPNLPPGSYVIEGDSPHAWSAYDSAGCGCGAHDSCNSCDRGCGLFSWLRWPTRNSCGGGCYQEPVSCCDADPCGGHRKSWRLFSFNWFRGDNCREQSACCDVPVYEPPAASCCDPCQKRGWLDGLFARHTRRDCNYQPTCCDAEPSCGCGSGQGLFGWLRLGHHRGHCGCESCGSGYVSHGDYHFDGQHTLPAPTEIPADAAPQDLSAPTLPSPDGAI